MKIMISKMLKSHRDDILLIIGFNLRFFQNIILRLYSVNNKTLIFTANILPQGTQRFYAKDVKN